MILKQQRVIQIGVKEKLVELLLFIQSNIGSLINNFLFLIDVTNISSPLGIYTLYDTNPLNIYDFGNNGDGIRSASRIYFGKEPIDLDVSESAMLVGMLKNSSLYNPRPTRNPVGVKNRRNVVLSQMHKYGFIDKVMKDSLQLKDLKLNYTPESHRDGIAPYFREYLRSYMKDWVKDKKNRKPDGSKYNINTDGIKIHTTINHSMQVYAEDAINQHMPRLQKEFFKQNTIEDNPTAPFRELTEGAIDTLLRRAMKRSERWRKMKYDLKKPDEVKSTIEAFPNPASSFTNVIIGFEYTSGTANLYDLAGRLLQSFAITSRTVPIDLSGLPEGIYIVNIDTNNGKEGIKVIKQEIKK